MSIILDEMIRGAVAKRANRLRTAPTVLPLGANERPTQNSFAGNSIVEELRRDAVIALVNLGGLVLQNTRLESLESVGNSAKFDLFVTLDDSGPTRRLVLEHATAVVSEKEARHFAAKFEQIAIAIAHDPTQTVSQVISATESTA